MKRLSAIAVLLCLLLAFAACENSNDTKSNDDSTAGSLNEETTDNTDSVNTESSVQTNSVPTTHTEYVIRSFYAIQGAVIYDVGYGTNGYPEQCWYHKKCESCGYVSNENGNARSNITSSYHCNKCGNNQKVEIATVSDWVDILD